MPHEGDAVFHTNTLPQFHNVSTLQWLIHFKVPSAIPLKGTIPYTEVASACGVDVAHLRRVLRFCMVNRLFHEPQPDQVGHTLFSSSLVTDSVLLGELEFLCEDSFRFSTRLVDAHERWPGSAGANHAASNLACDTDLQRYAYLALPGSEREGARFTNMLEFARRERATDVRFVPLAYPWQDLGDGLVVDVGGGTGDVAVALARAFPRLQVTVEDGDRASIATGRLTMPPELKDRIRLVERNFFQPRTPEDAGGEGGCGTTAYFLRMILHNWPDEDVARIIQPLLPGVRAGARLLIMEMVVPRPGTVPETMEWWMRSLDMEMMLEFNSKVRSKEDWETLFEGISTGLVMKSATTPQGSGLTVMEFAFKQ